MMMATTAEGGSEEDASKKSNSNKLPKKLVDAHHHFFDTKNNEFSRKFVGSLLPDTAYLPEQYRHDVIEPLQQAGVTLVGSVHLEGMPDDGVKEAKWIDSLAASTKVAAIVASCNLADDDVANVEANLQQLSSCCKVKGVRWILDCVGKFEPNTATHIATTRHDGIDYLRGSTGGYDGEVVPEFERGFALLAKYNLSFDLQCAPAQLIQAALLCSRHPDIPVCINHLGKPRMLLGPDNSDNDDDNNKNTCIPDEHELSQWRAGMKAMAQQPHVYVKISMLGYAVPGWIKTPERVALVQTLVHEVVALFGANRCMVALNWWNNAAASDSDGLSTVGPDPVQFLEYLTTFFEDYSDEERQRLFVGTAREFYRFSS